MQLSVIIPTIKRKWLTDAVESVRQQTVSPLEIIIPIDHGSNQYVIMNDAIRRCKGDAFIILSDDDKLDPTFIERTLPFLETHDIVHTNIRQSDNTTHFPGKFPFFTSLITKAMWKQVGGYDEQIGNYADMDFYWMCQEHGAKFHHIPEPLWFYRLHPGQGVATITNTAEQQEAIYKKHQ